MDLVGHSRDQCFEEAAGRHHVGGLHELNEGELGRLVDGNEEVEFAFCGSHLGMLVRAGCRQLRRSLIGPPGRWVMPGL